MSPCFFVSMSLCLYVSVPLCLSVSMHLCLYVCIYLFILCILFIYVSYVSYASYLPYVSYVSYASYVSMIIYVSMYLCYNYVYRNTSMPSPELPRHFSTFPQAWITAVTATASSCRFLRNSFSRAMARCQTCPGCRVLITSTLPQNHGFVMLLCMLQLFFARFVVLARDWMNNQNDNIQL